VEFSRGPFQPASQPASQPAGELGSHLVAQPSSNPGRLILGGATYRFELEPATALDNENESLFLHGPPFFILPRPFRHARTKHEGFAYSGRHRESRLSKSFGVFSVFSPLAVLLSPPPLMENVIGPNAIIFPITMRLTLTCEMLCVTCLLILFEFFF